MGLIVERFFILAAQHLNSINIFGKVALLEKARKAFIMLINNTRQGYTLRSILKLAGYFFGSIKRHYKDKELA